MKNLLTRQTYTYGLRILFSGLAMTVISGFTGFGYHYMAWLIALFIFISVSALAIILTVFLSEDDTTGLPLFKVSNDSEHKIDLARRAMLSLRS